MLRILFTLMVVIAHTGSVLGKPSAAGYYAVEFFFVLSGFFLIWTFTPERTVSQIMIKKYLMWTPLIVFGGILTGRVGKAFRGLFYLQNMGIASWKDIPNAPAWYLAVLFWGTLFYLGLMKTMKDSSRNVVIGCLIFVMAILLQSAPTGERTYLIFSLIPVGILRGFIDMGLGYFLAIGLKQINIENVEKTPIMWSILEVGLLIWIFASPFIPKWRTETRILIPLAMVVLIYLFISKKGILSRSLNRPIFVKLARPCLAVYLTHWAVIRNLGRIVHHNKALIEDQLVVVAILTVVIAWILGIISYLVIEKPCNQVLLKRFIKKN